MFYTGGDQQMNGQTMTFQDVWQSMIAKLPQMLAAVLILVGGYILALLIASTTRMVLRRLNIDTYVQNWLGDEGVTPRVSPSNWISRVVYYIVLLFVLVAFFQVLGLTLITVPLNRFLEQIFVYAPRLLGAAALLGIAILVANIARLVVRRVLSNIRLDERVRAETGEAVLPTSQVAANTIYLDCIGNLFTCHLGGIRTDRLNGASPTDGEQSLRCSP
jgi:hypothetical protein